MFGQGLVSNKGTVSRFTLKGVAHNKSPYPTAHTYVTLVNITAMHGIVIVLASFAMSQVLQSYRSSGLRVQRSAANASYCHNRSAGDGVRAGITGS